MVAARGCRGEFVLFNGYTGEVVFRMQHFLAKSWAIVKNYLYYTNSNGHIDYIRIAFLNNSPTI